jgi:hypothetical protein
MLAHMRSSTSREGAAAGLTVTNPQMPHIIL